MIYGSAINVFSRILPANTTGLPRKSHPDQNRQDRRGWRTKNGGGTISVFFKHL